MIDVLDRFRREPDAPELPGPPACEPPKEHDRRRGLVAMGPADDQDQPTLTIDEARAYIRQQMSEHLAMPAPAHILLVALPPGSGKTTEAVRQGERWAVEGRGRVLFAGPRHNLWDDLMAASTFPPHIRNRWWYHWQPHTAGNPETGQGQTCRYARQFEAWVERGYQGIEFCSKPQVCGWSYIKNQCPYHAQKKQRQPLVFVQHADIALKHPFAEQATLLIGDELPLSAFLHAWHIPARDIIPSDVTDLSVTPDTDLIDLFRRMRDLADRPPRDLDGQRAAAWEGEALLRQLGGAPRVLEVCERVTIDVSTLAYSPRLWSADEAEQVPYSYVRDLVALLVQEATEAIHGRDYLRRVRVDSQGVTLLLRRYATALPQHVIWMDATANVALYRDIFTPRPIKIVAPRVKLAARVYQVWASLNNKDALVGPDQDELGKRPKKRASKRAEVERQVQHIAESRGYGRVAVISYKDLVARFSAYETAYFGNLRGTNRLQEHDALIIVGTPQAAITTMVDQGAMLRPHRTHPFDTIWSDQIMRYGAHPYGYAASGFWHDTTLQALLYQNREAELVQAAHRLRPLYRSVDIWMLTNLPLADLPPDELLSLQDLFDAPKGVDYQRWPDVLALLARAGTNGLSADDLRTALDLPQRTAERWHAALRSVPGVEVRQRASRGGRPTTVCVKRFAGDFPPRFNKYIY